MKALTVKQVLAGCSLLIVGVCFVTLAFGQAAAKPLERPMWEYKLLRVEASGGGYSRLGSRFSSVGSEATGVMPSQMELDRLGVDGWELTTSYLEMETSFPNFARGDTVEGLKSNVRPQAVVFLFKRRTSLEHFARKLELEAQSRAMQAKIQDEHVRRELARKKEEEARLARAKKEEEEALNKAETLLLDGVLPDPAYPGEARILAAKSTSRFSAGDTILGIQADPKGPLVMVKTWADVSTEVLKAKGKEIRVKWRSSSDPSTEYEMTIRLP